ncbi:MFS transporter [Chromobacterium haemolyticum]|uniref:MFS transporter n=1 Tax=Chromobacterium haemolyticum TaxID=394935 RepID=A0ABS3GMI1_9NEIS|nr:MFS transporter [Chromobacterium haemolyticum]MBK0415077.1 MFS transporter [Chromobacterium haemolyticum]MBO0416253.1 MFS transporter [Chromobacterium haemolyticum]MBO0499715.1 MFS transporter [Chromobacterium haemolyticum]
MNEKTLTAPQAALAQPAGRLMALACLIVFMAQMATTVYLPSLPAVMRELAMSQSLVEMSISGYVVGAALPVLFWGSAADRWGRRGPLLISLALFIVCSLLLAFVSNAAELLALRVAQGIAGGGAAIIARIIVRDHWRGDDLARKLSVLSIAFITALGGGQFIGGLIGKYSHWEAGFALMAVTGVAAALLSMGLPLQAGRPAAAASGPSPYWSILRRPGFLWPACAGGLGFATTVTLQEVSPFVFQEHFGLAVAGFGNVGLLIGLSYFSGAMVVNRLVARVGGLRLMRAGAALLAAATLAMLLGWHLGLLERLPGLWLFIGLYCLTIFGQAVLFPNSMATAVSDAKEHGAHAMALCGFLQQGLAGIAATVSVLLHHDGAWTLAVAALGLLTLFQVLFKVRARAS